MKEKLKEVINMKKLIHENIVEMLDYEIIQYND